MKFCAIISEFNPFHNGHAYIIEQAKKIFNLPVLCLMSGDFVQRGEPAIVDKYTRATCAISSGADMVIQLPTIYSLSSAQNFAQGSIKVLKDLGCTHLVIGVTHTNMEDYLSLAKIKNTNLKNAISSQLDNGTNYSKALIMVLKNKYPNCDKIFTDASNILALEYIGQNIKQNANLEIALVSRTDNGYNCEEIHSKTYANATTIRKLIQENNSNTTKKYIPTVCQHQLDNVVDRQIIEHILFHNLRSATAQQLNECYDYCEGLPYLINSASQESNCLQEVIKISTSKRYRSARIKKLCIYPTLGITKTAYNSIFRGKMIAKLLAIKSDCKPFISLFNKHHKKIIVSRNDYDNLTKSQKLSADIDLRASNLYTLASKKPFNNDIKTGTLFIK